MQEDGRGGRSYSVAKAVFWSLSIVAVLSLLSVHWLPIPALALAAGGVCGAINSLLSRRSGERLLQTRSIGTFVISSFLRVAVFGIVPVAFAALGPWWSMACYFAGFFLPLALYAVGTERCMRS